MFKIRLTRKAETEFDCALGGCGRFRKLIKIIVSMWESQPESLKEKTITFHLKPLKGANGYASENLVIINKNILTDKTKLIQILLHEVEHLWQFMTRKLILCECGEFVFWKGKKRPSRFDRNDDSYRMKPWEVCSRLAERRAGEALSCLETA